MKKSFFVFSIVALLAGCDSFTDSFIRSYDEAFKKSFEKSFVKSCSKRKNSNELLQSCKCMAEELIANRSVKELNDRDGTIEYARKVAAKKCM